MTAGPIVCAASRVESQKLSENSSYELKPLLIVVEESLYTVLDVIQIENQVGCQIDPLLLQVK